MQHRGKWWLAVSVGAGLSVLAPARNIGWASAAAADAAPERDARLKDLERRIEALEKKPAGAPSDLLDKTHFHGYGEVHYNNPKNGVMTYRGTSAETDVHRLVLGLSHEFNDSLRLDLEIDFEHAAKEIELEYAYLEFDLTPGLSLRAGSLLMPFGSLNETHEPPNYYSVERPQLQQKIIPTTWQQNGAGVAGRVLDGQVAFRAYLVNGLDAAKFTTLDGLHDGGTGSNQTPADDFAAIGRAEYRPFKGLRLGASGYYGEADQGDTNPSFNRNITVGMYGADALCEISGFELKGEYAAVENPDAELLGTRTRPVGSRMEGWNAELAYHLAPLFEKKATWDLVPFVRYERIDTNNRVPSGFSASPEANRRIVNAGLAYYPIRNVAIKADVEFWETNAPGVNPFERYNLGIAWMF